MKALDSSYSTLTYQLTTNGTKAQRYFFKLDGTFNTSDEYGPFTYGGMGDTINYYSNFPVMDVYNMWSNLVEVNGYNPNVRGQIPLTDAQAGLVRDARLVQLPEIHDFNLGKMFNAMLAKTNSESLSRYYYLILPKYNDTKTVQLGYSIILVDKSNDYADPDDPNNPAYLIYNHYVYTDATADLIFESLELKIQGRPKYPLHLFQFDLDFNLTSYAKDPLSSTSIDMVNAPVYYTNLSVIVRVGIDSTPYVDKSSAILDRINARRLTGFALETYNGTPDAQISNDDLVINDNVLIKMFQKLGQDRGNWSKTFTIQYLITREGDRYLMYLPMDNNAKLYATVADPTRNWITQDLENPNSRVTGWKFIYKKELFTPIDLRIYYFDLDGNFIEATQSGSRLELDLTEKVYYTDVSCGTIGGSPTRLCTSYGGKPVSQYVYDWAINPGNGDSDFEAITGTVAAALANADLGALLAALLAVASSFSDTTKFFGGILDCLPDGVRELVIISFNIFLFLTVYKIYRVIRGLLV